MQKRYNKMHLNDLLGLYYFLYTVYFSVVTSHKMLFSCISMSSLSYVKKILFLKEVGENLITYSNQTKLQNQLYISTESPKLFFVIKQSLIYN